MTRNKIGAAALAALLVFAPFANAAGAGARAAVKAGAQDDGPSDAEQGMFTKGQNLFIQGNYEQAISVLKDFLKTYPSSVITDLTLLAAAVPPPTPARPVAREIAAVPNANTPETTTTTSTDAPRSPRLVNR